MTKRIVIFKELLKKISQKFPGKFDKTEIKDFSCFQDYKEFDLSKFPLCETDEDKIQKIIDKFHLSRDISFILNIKNAWIEPVYGWVIQDSKVFEDCFLHKNDVPVPPKNLLNCIRLFFGRKKIANVITLLEVSSANYCHFYQEILIRLVYLAEFVNIRDFTIVVSHELYYSRYFKELINLSPYLSSLRFEMLGTRHILCENLYIVRPPYDIKHYIQTVIDYIPQRTDMSGQRKIFLTRNLAKTARKSFILDYNEVLDIVGKYGFETLDTANLSLSEQIEVFENTRYLIAIHGAGETNILWRRDRKLSILELFDPLKIDIVFNRWCKNNEYCYDAIVGKSMDDKIHFQINLDILKLKIEKMLSLN